MYIPPINLIQNKLETLQFMKRFSFATIVTSSNGVPTASHLPFIINERDGDVILSSHFAKANKQWEELENGPCLVIFAEPHAYISPSHYDKELNVPTWNYVAVHAYGNGRILSETDKAFQLLEATINTFENSYLSQWNIMPEDFKLKMLGGIVAFEIVVTDLQGKKKLSQNRSEMEKQRIIESLSNSWDSNEMVIGEYMRNEIKP